MAVVEVDPMIGIPVQVTPTSVAPSAAAGAAVRVGVAGWDYADWDGDFSTFGPVTMVDITIPELEVAQAAATA